MNGNMETIETYLLRLIEDVAVVKTRLNNLDDLSTRVETTLDKIDKQAVKMEAANIEINALKREIDSLDQRINELEDTMRDDIKSVNNDYKKAVYTVITSVVGAIILYFLNIN